MSSSTDSMPLIAAPRLVDDTVTASAARGSDEELVAQAQAGDESALRTLYRRHTDGVFRRLTHLVGPEPDREDLLQEVFAEVFGGIHRFRGEAHFRTYLYRIATNIACDHLRGRCRRDRLCGGMVRGEEPAETISPDPSPEVLTIRRQQLLRAWGYLDRIKPKKRVAFLLRVMEGLSIEEIADQVGAMPATVAKRIMHTQRELLAMMQRAEREVP